MNILSTLIVMSIISCRSDEAVTKFNSNPLANITSHSTGESVLESYPIRFMGTGSDPNHAVDVLTATWYAGTMVICEATALQTDGTTVCEYVVSMNDSEITLVIKDPENASSEAKIELAITPTAAPSAEITAPSLDGVYYADQLITFEGRVSDAEDEVEDLLVSWDSSLDGELNVANQPNPSGRVDGATYLTEGEHYLRLSTTDTSGKIGTDNITINVGPANSVPSCAITAPATNSAGQEGEVVTFSGTVSDPDVAASLLTVQWTSDKDGDLGQSTPDSSGSVTFPYDQLSVNTHVISMTVRDEVGAECVQNLTYRVGTPPSVVIDTPADGTTLSEGELISFSATVSDGQDQADDLALDWQLNGTNFSTQGATSTGTATFSDSSLEHGTYSLVLTATDTDGFTDSDQVNFIINGLPSQPVISLTPSPAYTDNQLLVTLDTPSVDPEGNTINYTYEWLLGGASQSAYTASTLPASATQKGEQWTVRVTPNDGIADGPSAETTIVIQNAPPSISSVTISPSTNIYQDTILTCAATASDPDESLSSTYVWSINGSAVGGGSSLDLSTISPTPLTVIQCTAFATDSDGLTASDSTTVQVENRLPTADSVTLSPTTLYTNDTVTATASLSDADSGQTLTATYAWHVIDFATGVDTEVQSGGDSTLSGISHFDRDDEMYVIVTPNDGISDGTAVTSTSLTIANSAPSEATISLSPNPAIEGQDDLVCTVDTPATDDDNDPLLYTYIWTDPNGNVQQTTSLTAATLDSLPASDTAAGTWTCELTPSDGSVQAASVSATAEVEVGCASLYFDASATTDHVSFAQNSNFALQGAFTIEFWAKWSGDLGEYLVPVSFNHSSQGWVIRSTSGNNWMGVAYVGGSWFEVEGGSVEVDTWQHVAVTYVEASGSTTVSVFVDGELTTSSTRAGSITYTGTEQLAFGNMVEGSNFPGVNRQFFGHLGPIRISNNLRYTSTFTPTTAWTADSNTIGLWRFSDFDSTLSDASGNSLDGTVNGASWVNNCPDEDLDNDGVVSWQDCDDNNGNITTTGTGLSASCPARSCLSVLDQGYSSGSGYYWLDPAQSGAFQAYCDMSSAGGGWTRVARLDGSTPGYCGGGPSGTYDLTLYPSNGAGKIPDAIVQAITAGSSYNQIMYYTGQGGQAEFLYTTMNDPYDTTQSYSGYCTWTCANGANDSTTCGPEYIGCGFSGRGSGGNNKKLYIGATSGGHAYSLHSGGGFCGLDNRPKYSADVYVR